MLAKLYKQSMAKPMKYFSKHVMFNSMVHLVGGVGLGFLLANPVAMPHPIRWGVGLIAVSLAGHVYTYYSK